MPQKTKNCPYCQSKRYGYKHRIKVQNVEKLAPIFQLTHQKFVKLFSFNIIECKDCGLFYTDRILTNSEATTFYNYRTYEGDFSNEAQKNYYISLLDFISSYISLQRKKFVDIGCAFGYMLDLARERGAIPIGFEIDKKLADYGRNEFNLTIIEKDFLKYNHPSENYYDIIVLSAVIEHLKNPIAYLKKIYALLKPQGVLYLDTPETCFFTKYIMRERHFGYVLGHYTFPSRKLITQKLNEIGFQVLAVKSPKLSINKFINFIPKLVKFRNEKITSTIERERPDELYISRNKISLQLFKNTPLLPFSLGYCRILCQK